MLHHQHHPQTTQHKKRRRSSLTPPVAIGATTTTTSRLHINTLLLSCLADVCGEILYSTIILVLRYIILSTVPIRSNCLHRSYGMIGLEVGLDIYRCMNFVYVTIYVQLCVFCTCVCVPILNYIYRFDCL